MAIVPCSVITGGVPHRALETTLPDAQFADLPAVGINCSDVLIFAQR